MTSTVKEPASPAQERRPFHGAPHRVLNGDADAKFLPLPLLETAAQKARDNLELRRRALGGVEGHGVEVGRVKLISAVVDCPGPMPALTGTGLFVPFGPSSPSTLNSPRSTMSSGNDSPPLFWTRTSDSLIVSPGSKMPSPFASAKTAPVGHG